MLRCLLNSISLLPLVVGQPPTWPPQTLSFTDRDLDEFELGGAVEFHRANFEHDISYYTLYFGTSETTVHSLLANLPVPAGGTKINLGMDYPLPAGATHFIVFSANSHGVAWNMASSCVLHDKAVPVNPPSGVSFQDIDDHVGEIGGVVSISRALDETDISHYAVFFGSSPTVLKQAVPNAYVAKTTNPLELTLPLDTPLPSNSAYMLAYTSNADGLSYLPAATSLYDRILPTDTSSAISFEDLDTGIAEISGYALIEPALDETYVLEYVVFFARGASGPLDLELGSVAKSMSGSTVSVLLAADTQVPYGVTHLLVKTRNVDGDSHASISLQIIDKAVPVEPATSLSFNDIDIDRFEIGGTIYFTKADDESDITYYNIYCLSEVYEITGSELSSIPKGNETIYTFPEDLPLPSGSAYLSVLAGNADGVALVVNGFAIPLVDKAVPLNPPLSIQFLDEDDDGGEISGRVIVQRAADENDVVTYTCYYGTAALAVAQNRLSLTPLNIISVTSLTSSFAVFNVGHHTVIPVGATHFLAFSANPDGEIRTGLSVEIIDRTVDFPVAMVSSVQFPDLDLDMYEIGGPVIWHEPLDTTGLTKYTIYMALDEQGSLRVLMGETPIGDSILTLPYDTHLHHSFNDYYTHILVYTNNLYGEGLNGFAKLIVDRAIPVASVSGVTFVDTDPGIGTVGGVVSWTSPENPALPVQFLYFSIHFANTSWPAAAEGHELQGEAEFPATTFEIPAGAEVAHYTQIVVVTKNAAGEALVGTAVPLADRSPPYVTVSMLNFFDQDLGVDELGGPVGWREPLDTSMVTFYRVYFELDNGTRQVVGESPVGTRFADVPFDTPIGNIAQVIVVTTNPTGEAPIWSNVSVFDNQPGSCPSSVGHHHVSARWRVVAGAVTKEWRVKAVRFYEDSDCIKRLPTVPKSWPRRPLTSSGHPFANPSAPTNLYEVFKIPTLRYTWDNGTKIPPDQAAGPWWSSGSPCISNHNSSNNAVEFDPNSSGCFLGFSWFSDSLVLDGRVAGSTGNVKPLDQNVHCIDLEQSELAGEFAEHIAIQWFDVVTQDYKSLLQQRVDVGGLLRIQFQPVLAKECLVNR